MPARRSHLPVHVPPALARNVTETWGARGGRWLAELPVLLATVAADWELEVGPPFDLSYHWVCPVTFSDGREAVLKLGPAWPGHLAAEATTLSVLDGRGAVRLLASDLARGALLLERVMPGTPATSLTGDRDTDATAAAITLMRELNATPPRECALPDLTEQGASFTRYLRDHPGDGPLPRHLVERAASLFGELCASAPGRAVLHGDLHHDNILRATRRPWLAIDPHGVVGDPGYEVGALLYNPDPARRDDSLLALVPARVEQLADGLAMPVERIVAWGFVKAVLSEVWVTEGGGEPGGRALDVASHLLPSLP